MDSLEATSDAAEPRVLVIMTGGTICMKRSPDGFIPCRGFLKRQLAPRVSFNDGSPPEELNAINSHDQTISLPSLRTPMSSYDKRVRFCVLEFDTLLDSSSIDSDGWTSIGQAIYRNYAHFDGFVVLHGTDSLAYTCSALSFMLRDLDKPVILTGSQKPMSELQSDATDNLIGSLIVASHFAIPEVCLFFNFALYRGNRTTKIAAADFAAFASPNYPPLATVSASGTSVRWHLVRPRPQHTTNNTTTAAPPLSLHTYLHTAHVACLRIFPGIKPEMVQAVCLVPDLRGLVLETYGSGNAPSGPDSALTNVLAAAAAPARGIVIVSVTQCLSGSVGPTYAPATALGRAGVVFGRDLTSEAALAKLAYLLALPGLGVDEVKRQMGVSLRGEMGDAPGAAQFERPNGV